MKLFIGEYGKVIVLTVLTVMLSSYMFGRNSNDFLGLLSQAKPEATVNNQDNFQMLKSISKRDAPALSLKTKKLRKGTAYNLLDAGEFQIIAKDADGNIPLIAIVKIIDPKEADVTAQMNPYCFVPEMRGAYLVTYKAADTCEGPQAKTTEKTYSFVVT